jgi:Putative transposase
MTSGPAPIKPVIPRRHTDLDRLGGDTRGILGTAKQNDDSGRHLLTASHRIDTTIGGPTGPAVAGSRATGARKLTEDFLSAFPTHIRKGQNRACTHCTRALKAGAIAVVQRFNSALDASPHFHTLFLDGVYSFPVGSTPVFHPTPAPRDEDIALVAAAVCHRVERKLSGREAAAAQRHFEESAQLWWALAGASVEGIAATGARRGRYLVGVRGARADVDAFVTGRLCADVAGFYLQAVTRIAANDRAGLERMARYLARPPIATDRLSRLDDGRLKLQLKRPWRDGTTAFVLTPHELIERLVALVPRPRAHLTRYFGVFAPAFAARAAIVPAGVTKTPRACAGVAGADDPATTPVSRRRFPWASLIWRVFLKDVLECARCKGRMQIVTALTSREHRTGPQTPRARPRRSGISSRAAAAADRAVLRRRAGGLPSRPARARRLRCLKPTRGAYHELPRTSGEAARVCPETRAVLVFPVKTGILGAVEGARVDGKGVIGRSASREVRLVLTAHITTTPDAAGPGQSRRRREAKPRASRRRHGGKLRASTRVSSASCGGSGLPKTGREGSRLRGQEFESFQSEVDETADVSLTLETIACCNYPTPQARLRNGIEEADGSIPLSSTKSVYDAEALAAGEPLLATLTGGHSGEIRPADRRRRWADAACGTY